MDDYQDFLDELRPVGVFLDGLSFTVDRELTPERGARVRVNSKGETEFLLSDEVMIVRATFTVAGREKGVRKAFARVKVSFDLVLSGDVNEQALDEYGERLAEHARWVLWPYLRELVDSVAARAGVSLPMAALSSNEMR